MLQEEFQEYELAWQFEEAIPIRALADIENYPALANVTNDMSKRLMIAGENGLVMFVPETANEIDEKVGSLRDDPMSQSSKKFDPSQPLGGTLKAAKFSRLYRGHRANTKDAHIVFTVQEATLFGSIGKCLRFIVEVRPRERQNVRMKSGKGKAPSRNKSMRLQFYYSTTLLQHILVSIEALKQPWLKKELCRNLCKYMEIYEEGIVSHGTPELQFSLKRLDMESVMIDGLPGGSQSALDKRLAQRDEIRLDSPRQSLLKGVSLGERPAWRNTFLKVVTESEKYVNPHGSSTLELLYREDRRAITPDSVVLHDRLGMSHATRVGAVVGGNITALNSTNDDWRNKALLPAQRIASLPPLEPNLKLRRDAKFYAAKHENMRHNHAKPRYLDHTAASHASQWEQRHRPKDVNDLLLSHDHQPNHGGNVSLWSNPLSSPRSPRIGATKRKFGSTSKSKATSKSDDLRPTEIVLNTGASESVRAARSIVRERAETDGVLGRTVHVHWNIC